jgi:hypothetical protein
VRHLPERAARERLAASLLGAVRAELAEAPRRLGARQAALAAPERRIRLLDLEVPQPHVPGEHDTLHVDVPERDYPKVRTLRGCVDYLMARMG